VTNQAEAGIRTALDGRETTGRTHARHNSEASKKDVVGVQYLRGLAAMLVVLHHARDQFPATQALVPTAAFQGGVDIFFVISGFIMMYTTTRQPMTGWQFFKRRLIRILPLYWSMTALVAVAAAIAPRLFHDTRFTFMELVTSLFFVPWPNPGTNPPDIAPLIKLGWTLNYEMFFYVFFALFVALAPLKRLGAIAVTFSALAAVWIILQPTQIQIRYWSDPIILEFVVGCCIGLVEAKGLLSRVPVTLSFLLLAVSSFAFLYLGQIVDADGLVRVAYRGLPAIGITLAVICLDRIGALSFPARISAFALMLGNASYAIYLSHLYSVRGFSIVWERLHLPIGTWSGALAYVLLCIGFGGAIGVLCWRSLEIPATTWARRRFS
jgi:exopolysaccharide production protein ExoZ